MKQVVIKDRSVHLDRLSGIKFFAFISAVFFFPAKQRPQFSSSTCLRDGAAAAAAAADVLGFSNTRPRKRNSRN